MRRWFPLFLLLLAASGCRSTPESESFMYWRKSSITARVTTPHEMEQIGRQAQQRLEQIDLREVYEPLLAAEFPPNSYKLEERRHDTLVGTDWHPPYWDLDGRLFHARLSVAVGHDFFTGGDLMVEAILSGYTVPEQEVNTLATRIVTEVVERLAAVMIETAEAAGKRASVVHLEHSGP